MDNTTKERLKTTLNELKSFKDSVEQTLDESFEYEPHLEGLLEALEYVIVDLEEWNW